MRTPTKLELTEDNARLRRYTSLLSRALMLVVEGTPYATEIVKGEEYPEDEWEYRLYEPMGADGGIVVEIFRHPGQRDQVDARYLDECTAPVYMVAYRTAIDRLKAARSHLYQAEREAREARCAKCGGSPHLFTDEVCS